MKTIETIFRNFKGNWQIVREMHKSETGLLNGNATGVAEFDPVNDLEYIYKEKCDASYPPNWEKHTANWEYRYHLNKDRIDVYHYGRYEDKLYLSYQFNNTTNRLNFVTPHDCALDNYEGFYELIDENQFNLVTMQEGPNKGNIIRTEFRRTI